jgi:hypothetical protein
VTTVPLPKPTRDLHRAAGLSREAMHHREARSNTSADTFGGEERLLGCPNVSSLIPSATQTST